MDKTAAEWLETFLCAVNKSCPCRSCNRVKGDVAKMQKRIEEDATINAICKEDEDFKAHLFKTCDMKVPMNLDQSKLGASDIIYLLEHVRHNVPPRVFQFLLITRIGSAITNFSDASVKEQTVYQHYKDADLLDNTCVTQTIEYSNRLSQVKPDQ